MESAKEKILEIATKLFAEKGFTAVSIRELTVQANVNVSAISYYFGGKEGLYQEVIKGQLSFINDLLEEIENKKGLEPIDKIKKFMQVHSSLRTKAPYLGNFMNSEISNPTHFVGPIIWEHVVKMERTLCRFIKEGIEQGAFRADIDPVYSAIMILAITNFYFFAKPFEVEIQNYVENYEEIDSKSYIDKTLDVYLHGIAKV